MLTIRNLNVHYDGIHVLKDVSLEVEPERIVTLIGANGAGKSTLLRSICGLAHPSSGSILYLGKELCGRPTHLIARDGIAMVPEGRKVFSELSIYDNLMMGAYSRDGREESRRIKNDIAWIFSIFPRLEERLGQPAGTLSGGEQQMLALGRALMSRPRLLLLDEPSLGLSPLLIAEVFRTIRAIAREGMTILLIEQNARVALRISDLGYVLETGRITLKGAGRDLLKDEKVVESYLGGMSV